MKKQIGIVLAIAVVACGLYAAVAGASSSSHKSQSAQMTTKAVTVTMVDFHFKLSFAGPYKRGVKYVFKTVNKGNALHNFDIQRVKAGRVIPAGKSYTFSVVFKKAGKYPYVCDVPRHAELGMSGRLTVR
jgi:plastocyanin